MALPPTTLHSVLPFTIFSAYSEDEAHRGLLLAVSTSIPVVRSEVCLRIFGSVLIVHLICARPTSDFLLINFHGRTGMDETDRLSAITTVIQRFLDAITIIGGDFNCQLSSSESSLLCAGQLIPANSTSSFANFMITNRLIAGNYTASPHSRFDWSNALSSSILDLILISSSVNTSQLHTSTLMDIIGSDHVPVLMTVTVKASLTNQSRYHVQKLSNRLLQSAKHEIRAAMSFPWIMNGTVDEQLADIILHLETGVQVGLGRPLAPHPVLMPIRNHSNAGWPPDLVKTINLVKRRISKLQRIFSLSDVTAGQLQELSSLREQFRSLRARAQRQSRIDLEQQIFLLRTSDLSTFFRFAKSHDNSRASTHVGRLLLLNDQSEPVVGAAADQLLADSLTKVTSINPLLHSPLMLHYMADIVASPVDCGSSSPLMDSITPNELFYTLKQMKLGTAPGVDGIPVELLRVCTHDVRHALLLLFNQVVRTGIIPELWRTSITVPIPKKGDLMLPSNWRGISLLCSSYKLFATILARRLIVYLNNYASLHWTQSGFRAQCCTLDPIMTLHEVCSRRRVGNMYTHIVFADFKAAFDLIHLNALRAALHLHRVPPIFTDLLINLYSYQRALLRPSDPSDAAAEYYPETGVRQGCCLAPLLFSVVIDTLAWELQSKLSQNNLLGVSVPSVRTRSFDRLILLLYADDLVLVGHDQAALQLAVTHMETWSVSWGFSPSVSKSKLMSISPINGSRPPIRISFLQGAIENVIDFKYLGIVFSNDLSFVKEQAARRRLFQLAHVKLDSLYRNNAWTVKSRTLAYLSLTESVGLYGTPLWTTDLASFSKFKSMICGHLRILLSLPKVPSLSIACAELHIQHPWVLIKKIQGSWLAKHADSSTLLSHLIHSSNIGLPIFQLLKSFRKMGYTFCHSYGSPTLLYHYADSLFRKEGDRVKRIRMYFDYYHERRWALSSSQRLLHLHEATLHFGRSVLFQFRTGTWRTIEDECRIFHFARRLPLPDNIHRCLFCDCDNEDLHHYLLVCPQWLSLRTTFLTEFFDLLHVFPSFNSLSTQHQVATILGGQAEGTTIVVDSEAQLHRAVCGFLHMLATARKQLLLTTGW